MTAEMFAAEIGQRLREILPSGFEVWTDTTTVWVGNAGEPESGTGVEVVECDQHNYHVNLFELAAGNVLDHVQDYVVQCLRERWPCVVAADGVAEMPLCYVRLVDGVLRMGYGTEDAPVLVLRALEIE